MPPASFSRLKIDERRDLQRVIRDHIASVSPGTLVIAEEFSEWDDGGHMDLQAIRYAAMVSMLTFERVISILESFLRKNGRSEDAEKVLLKHLDWETPQDGEIASQVRVVLVSADFSQEITSTVLWLNLQGLDLRCVRLIPYQHGNEVLLDIQQVIPLPEAEDYMVKIREKNDEGRKAGVRRQNRDLSRYTIITPGGSFTGLPKRRAIQRVVMTLLGQGSHPDDIQTALPPNQRMRFHRVPGIVEAEEFKARALEAASQGGNSFEPDNWFISPEELIHAGGDSYVFSKRWGIHTVSCIKALILAFPACGISYETDRSSEESPST